MSTFPVSPTIGDIFNDFQWDGVAWKRIGGSLNDYATDVELALHADDTTNVHGIANTANLETTTGAQSKADAAQSAANIYTDNAIASFEPLPSQTGNTGKYLTTNGSTTSWGTVDISGPISTHNSDTTDVHGIADTSLLATKSYVDTSVSTAITGLVDSAPAALDTLNELAAALNDDANFSTTITNSLSLKSPLDSPTFTGTPSAPTATAGTNTTQIATTAFVQTAISSFETLPSQTSNSGKFLTTNGTTASWGTISFGYAQASEPSSPKEGQIWLDTDAEALYDSGFPTVIYSTTEPAGLDVTDTGTIWTNGNDNHLKIWDGSGWVSAILTYTYSSTQPSTPATGQVWVDSDDNNLYIYSGSVWVKVTQPGSSYSSSQPSSPQTGQLWIDSDDDKIYVWSGSAWVQVGGGESNSDQAIFAARMYG